MELLKITEPEEIRCEELRERARNTPLTPSRWHFVAREASGDELAFVSFDVAEHRDSLVLYELWVAVAHRGKGVGTALLDQAARIARESGYESLLVRPSPLSIGLTQRRLWHWYRDRGFAPWSEDPKVLQRLV